MKKVIHEVRRMSDDLVSCDRSTRGFSRPTLELIHPLSADFWVYGGVDTIQRAREWALENHHLLVRGVPACAHGFYMMDCPSGGCMDFGHTSWHDHVTMWVDADTSWMEKGNSFPEPFLLSATYGDPFECAAEAKLYADTHGLEIDGNPGMTVRHEPEHRWGDDWYSDSTTPIRIGLGADHVLWPIEFELITLLTICPVSWPNTYDEEEG